MERSIVAEEIHQTSNSDLVSKPVGSSIKIDSISIDLFSNEQIDAEKCDHFSIREYVSEMRKKNWKICDPFANLVRNHYKPVEQTCTLPPLDVPKFRWWRCQKCLRKVGAEGIKNKYGDITCSSTRSKSGGTYCRKAFVGDTAMRKSDFQQAPALNILEGRKVDASVATDLNDNNCHPSSSIVRKEKKFESVNTPIIGHMIGVEDNKNHEILVSTAAAKGVIAGLMMGVHHTDDIVAFKTNCNGSVELSKSSYGRHETDDSELANKNLKCMENFSEIGQPGKKPFGEEQHLKSTIACGISTVGGIANGVLDVAKSKTSEHPSPESDKCDNASSESAEMLDGNNDAAKRCISEHPSQELDKCNIASSENAEMLDGNDDDVVGAAKSCISEHPSPELDECNNASSESAEMLDGNDLQDHHDSSGSRRKKTRKVRLLTELLAKNGDASTGIARTENHSPNSVPDASAGVDDLSAPQGSVVVQGNVTRGLDPNRKRKFPHDEEWRPLEISSPNKLYTIDRTFSEGAKATDAIAISDTEEDDGIGLQIGTKSHLSKPRSDRSPTTGKNKIINTPVEEFMSTAPSCDNVSKDVHNKAKEANKVSAADNVFCKSAQTTFSSRGMYPFPLPPQKRERNSGLCKKKSKMPQFDDKWTSLDPWSNGITKVGPLRRKYVEIGQTQSINAPFKSAQDASTGNWQHPSLSRCFSTQGYDRKFISPLELRLLPWQGCSSKENQVPGNDIQKNYVADSNFPSTSEPDACPQEGVLSFLNEKQKATSQVGPAGYALMQQMDFSSASNNRKPVEMQEFSALPRKHGDQRADKVSEQGVPDDIPMEIVELMAKNQYERCLPDVVNDKRPLETSVNTTNAQICANGKLNFLSKVTASKSKSRTKNGRNGKTTRAENVGTTNQKSVDCSSHIDKKHFNMGQLEPTKALTGFRAFSQCQEKPPPGVEFSATSSSKHSGSQNPQWMGNMVGHMPSQTNLQMLGACNTCQSSQQSKEATHWSSIVPNHLPYVYNIPQKHAGPSTNIDVLSHGSSSLRKGNMNGNHDPNLLNLNANPEKHNRDSDTLSRPHAEYPITCKHSGMGSLDLYSNETIPAMHLLSLMDAGLQSSAPIDMDGTPKFFKRPTFIHNHHSKDLSGMPSGGYKTTNTTKHPPYDYFAKSRISENSREYFPAIPAVGPSGFSFQHDKGGKRTTDFTGQGSLTFQEREKSKGSASPPQNKGHRSQKSNFRSGGSGTNFGSIPVHGMQNMFLRPSDSMVFPLQLHAKENVTKHKLESCNTTSTNWPLKSSTKTDFCSVNRNPADISIPEAGNIYMIRGEDLKFRKPVLPDNRVGIIKLIGRKRQKKLAAAEAGRV